MEHVELRQLCVLKDKTITELKEDLKLALSFGNDEASIFFIAKETKRIKAKYNI